jgi:hypothetical protein
MLLLLAAVASGILPAASPQVGAAIQSCPIQAQLLLHGTVEYCRKPLCLFVSIQ